MLTSKTSFGLSQGSVTAGSRWGISEEIEGIGLNRFMDLEAAILNSTLEVSGENTVPNGGTR